MVHSENYRSHSFDEWTFLSFSLSPLVTSIKGWPRQVLGGVLTSSTESL